MKDTNDDSRFVKQALAEFNLDQRRRADPFSCPMFKLEDLTMQEISKILQRAQQLKEQAK